MSKSARAPAVLCGSLAWLAAWAASAEAPKIRHEAPTERHGGDLVLVAAITCPEGVEFPEVYWRPEGVRDFTPTPLEAGRNDQYTAVIRLDPSARAIEYFLSAFSAQTNTRGTWHDEKRPFLLRLRRLAAAAPDKTPGGPVGRRLTITTDPPGAVTELVLGDWRTTKTTPFQSAMPPGVYTGAISMPGFNRVEFGFTMPRDSDHSLAFTLAPETAPVAVLAAPPEVAPAPEVAAAPAPHSTAAAAPAAFAPLVAEPRPAARPAPAAPVPERAVAAPAEVRRAPAARPALVRPPAPRQPAPPSPVEVPSRAPVWGLAGGAAVAGAAAGLLAWRWWSLEGDARALNPAAYESSRAYFGAYEAIVARADTARFASMGLGALGGAAAIGAVVAFRSTRPSAPVPPVAVIPQRSGLLLSVVFDNP